MSIRHRGSRPETEADGSEWITLMNSSEHDELPLGESRPMQILPAGATLQDATEWLRSCGVIAEAVQAGEMIPDFELVNATGVNVNLGSLLDRGPVVITFILGSRSPTCRASLRALQEALPGIEAHHGTLVAISPDPPAVSSALAEEDGLGFDLLTDDHDQLGRLIRAHVPATGASRRLVRSSRPRRPSRRDAIGLDPSRHLRRRLERHCRLCVPRARSDAAG